MFSFIETRLFTKLVLEYLSDEQYGMLQQTLIPTTILRRIRQEVEDGNS